MSVSNAKRRRATVKKKTDNENRFFLYVIFYHLFTGISGIFTASLELSRQGLVSIMQKKSFDKILIKERK